MSDDYSWSTGAEIAHAVSTGATTALAAAEATTAPKIGQHTFTLDGVEMLVRANIGIYTQSISLIGLHVVAVPAALKPMPIALQIIAAAWREDLALRVAYALEKMSAVTAPRPNL
jgi:aspartyl-tRNA(Asn)/glutamyl-tRNA(Gln) amidotransferase subunit A